MPTAPQRIALLCLGAAAVLSTAGAAPVINEIMYHPPSSLGNPEDVTAEWIEIFNPDAVQVDVSGWKLVKGVAYTIPATTLLPGGGYLVVAANVAKFQANHPGFAGTVIGGWTGTLANGGEQIQIDDSLGAAVDDVTYADEGDWALRARGPLSFSHKGWIWETAADGGGRTVELRNPVLGSGSGQNWAVSAAAGGTPGAANSAASTNIAPLIKGAQHKPEIPRSSDVIRISCTTEDESPGAVTTLRWRLDGAGSFTSVPMADADADGDLDAQIPAQANLSVIEWYISATDGTNTRTWPAPARTSDIGVLPATFGQVTNALLQVDNSFDPARDFKAAGNQPVLRLVMTDAERNELNQIQTTNGEEDSEAAFNATFISHEGTGTKIVYNSSVRNRGFSSALGPPNNFHVSFRSDDKWNGRSAIQLNCQYGYSQVLGNVLFARAGIAPQDAIIMQLRVNGTDLAESGSRMYGRYAMLEGRGADWAEKHYPLDPDGNFYRLDDHAYPQGDPRSGEFTFEGTTATALNYTDTFFKETNKDADDWSDLINLCRIISAPATGGTADQPAISDAAYPAAVATVFDVDAFYRYIATDAVIGNREGGLQSGRADDVSIYRGMVDTRFRFVPHDMDDVFFIGNGVGDSVTRSLFSYDVSSSGVQGLTRMFNHPALLPKYYAAVLDALDTWYNHATLDPIIDQIMQGWVPANDGSPGSTPNRGINDVKGYIDARRANVLSQIQQSYSLTVTGNAADSLEGYKVTTTGAATFSGTFNVAMTYSITVNGQAAQSFYRTGGGDTAGTWRLGVPAGGGSVLRPGLNKVVVRFWDGLNGTGAVVHEILASVFYSVAGGTTVNGTLTAPGTVSLLAPASYIPGVPMLVRVDLKDGSGNLNRAAWNTTVNLTATNGVTLNPSTVTLTNGIGSALITVGSTTGGGTVNYLSYGSYPATPGSTWKYKTDFTSATLAAFISSNGNSWRNEVFDDSSWSSGAAQIGYGDSPRDEQTLITRVDYDTGAAMTQSAPAYLFRNTFTIADLSQLTALTGEVKFDDSCAVFVNGTEVYRHGDLTAAAPLTEYTETTTATTRENATAAITVPLGLVHNGVNTIAVEVHQHDAGSSDVSFDLRLQGNLIGTTTDPGNFSLTATAGSLNASKALTSLGSAAGTTVSGTLPAGVTNWSGVVRVTGDLTVPAGATLNIAAGTHVLMTGTSGAGNTAGTDLIVTGGTVNANGTAAQPVSITAHDAATRWGEINVGGSTTIWNHCLVSRGCHSPGGGHTGTGPCFRLTNGAVWTFDDGVISDLPGKTLTNSGNTTMTMRRSEFARCVMGPETDGSGITIEDCNFDAMLPAYRESGAADDEDNIYIHDSGGRPVNLRRSVFGNAGDDGIDLLGGSLTVEDCIIRNINDKGISLLQNNITVRRTQIIDCDFCVSTKTQIGSEATTYTTTLEACTLVGEAHPANQSDQSGGIYWHNVGVHVRNKYGTGPNAQLVVNAKDCIISAVTPMLNDYATAGVDHPLTTVSYDCFHDVAGTNPVDPAPPSGTGTIAADPLFISSAGRDFHLGAGSPCINTGDPALTDADGSRLDMGALPTGTTGGGAAGEIRWTTAGSPYRVTANTTVPAGATLRIDPGVNVEFDQNVRLRVEGRILAEGSPGAHIVFSHVPGTNLASDVDPIKLGTQTGAPKWGGVRVYDSMSQENVIRYCDFINAQGTSPSTSENYGSVGFIRSWGWVDHVTFAGTHLRMCYGRNSKMTVTHSTFPDMFIFDPGLNRIEEPTTDFIAAADNSMEPLKVEYPTTDAEVSGNANFPNGMPLNGHWRVYFNDFHGNRGHQDVFDCDSGRWAARDASGNQTNGQFVIDCRYNHFFGLAGDEHMDLGGDAYIASNVFENARKDFWTNDTGYSNAISSGDKGSGTTIMLARNVCYDLDHVINCKANTATIFEHNTVANIHSDFNFVGSTVTQNVVCAPINFFIPGDGANPSVGDGAYMGFNLVSNVPHVFSGPDANAAGNGITTKIEFFHNLLDQIADPAIGPNHPGGYFSGTYGPNQAGAPGFVDPVNEDYSLRHDSLARGTAPGGINYGANVPEWSYILGGPSGSVADTAANFTIGGPGVVAYKWRLDGGAWSASIQIGSGGLLPRATPTIRQAALALSSLTAGVHTLEVLGQDMAGNWQDADPARLYDGLPQAGPTVRTWTVDTTLPLVMLSEVYGDPAQQVELISRSASPVDLNGWSLSDSPLTPGEQALSGSLAPGALLTVNLLTFQIDNDGDEIYLFDAANVVRDSIVFGPLPAGYSLARVGAPLVWTLAAPSIGNAVNAAARTADSSEIVINEWLCASGIRYNDDWVELANLSPYPASLTGMSLTDSRFGMHTAFPPLSYIGGNGFVKVIADGNASAGANHTSFKMDGLTEEILLFAADGSEQDNVRYFPQIEDVSQGRVTTGGTGGYDFFVLATGGLANGTTDPGYANAVAILNGLRITEIMYNPAGGNDYEFIELTNTGAVALNLGGVVFYDGIDFTFPDAFMLAPGAQTVLVRNLVSFQNRYGSGLNVAGVYTGALDNNGEQLALRLKNPWDANVLRFRYESTWYGTNGTGLSLVLASNATPINEFDERLSWITGPNGGTPAGGTLPGNDLTTWLNANGLTMGDLLLDGDNDGLTNLVEYSLLTNPASPDASDGITAAPVAQFSTIGGNPVPALRAGIPTSAQPGGFGSSGVVYVVQDSLDLANWRDLLSKSPTDNAWQNVSGSPLTLVESLGTSGGRANFILKSPDSLTSGPHRHMRLKIVLLP